MYAVITHYPISNEEASTLKRHEYPSESYIGKERYKSLDAAKRACSRANRKLKRGAYAAVVDLQSGWQID